MAKRKSKVYTTVDAVLCPICEDLIYSCHRHHYNVCSCSCCMVDGGRDYTRYGYHNPPNDRRQELEDIEIIQIKIKGTPEELARIYNTSRIDAKVGIISKKDRAKVLGKSWELLFMPNKS